MTELNIISTLDLLNFHLAKIEQERSFIICGGAALILQKIATRTTQDVDVVAPEIDLALKQASQEVAKTLGLNEKEVAESYMKIYKQKLEKSEK